jgi:hypothetical protein
MMNEFKILHGHGLVKLEKTCLEHKEQEANK